MMIVLLAFCTFVGTGSPVPDMSPDRVWSPLNVPFKYIGSIRPRNASEIKASNWTIGCEGLDRDFDKFEKFREYTRGNSLALTNLTVGALFSLGGGMSELWCRHVRDGKTVFVLVYFESSLMDSLPRMFAHGDRINSVTGTVADSIDRYLRALKEHNRGLNACPYCGNAIWLVNPHFDVAFVCDVPPNVDVTRMTGDELAEIAHGLPKHARQEKMQRLLRPIQGSELKFSSCRVVGSDMDKDHCPHVDFVVLDPDTGEDAFSITVKLDDGKAAEWAKRIEKGAVVRNMRATLCEKEDFYFCRGAMTSLIWMRGLSFDGE